MSSQRTARLTMTNQPERAPLATEQLPITLFDGVVLAARAPDGDLYLAIRDICEVLGLSPARQRERIKANEALRSTQLRVFVGQQTRTVDFLHLEDLPTWLTQIQTRRVSEDARNRMLYVKAYLIAAVQQAFAQLTSLPTSSRQIEDIRDLDRIDLAFKGLEELAVRQAAIETSQDRARSVFRDLVAAFRDQDAIIKGLQTRVQALEAQSKLRLSPEQRGTIYQLVQAWGHAAAERQTDRRRGDVIRSCWRLFNQRFGLGTYTDLPAARYDESIAFIKEQYRNITGGDIDAIEQTGMELDG